MREETYLIPNHTLRHLDISFCLGILVERWIETSAAVEFDTGACEGDKGEEEKGEDVDGGMHFVEG